MTSDDARFAPGRSFSHRFSDGERFAASIPGGRFDYLPADGPSFDGTVRLVNLGESISVRTTAVTTPLLLRSELVGGHPPTTTYLFPFCRTPRMVVDGKDIDKATIFSRESGQSPIFRTYGPIEVGSIVILKDALRQASAVLTGRENSALLLAPATLRRIAPEGLATLHEVYLQISRLVDQPHFEIWAQNTASLALMRDRVATALIDALVNGDIKTDHLAHQLQTASMARIDRLIDENRHTPIGLQELCEKSGMAMRTIEAIVRRRMQMTAHAYLQLRRLRFARTALLNPSGLTNVTGIAMTYGFTHLGRFSSIYRNTYGELPSETLQNVLGRKA